MPGQSGHFAERRRAERYALQGVKGTLHLSATAKIVNMSMTGMAVEADAHLRVGRLYSISVRHATDAILRLTGSVVWCRLRDESAGHREAPGPAFEAGLRFHRSLGHGASDLARILEAASLTDASPRTSGRFKVKVQGPVNFDAACPFAARTISTVGILVETQEAVPIDTIVEAEVQLRETALRARGRIARISEVAGPRGETLSQLGIEFVESSEAGREAIRRFVGFCSGRPGDEASG